MRIVHILSQVELTGAEVHALTLAKAQSMEHQVWVISNALHLNYSFSFHFLAWRIHTSSLLVRWQNIFSLVRLIAEHKIDVLHTHSRAAVRVAFWAQKIFRLQNFFQHTKHAVVHITTLHGQQHSSLSKKLFDLYGDRAIFICNNAKLNTQKRLKINPRKCFIVPNPLDIEQWRPRPQTIVANRVRWAMLGRSSGPKGLRHKQFLLQMIVPLLQQHPQLSFDLIGYSRDWWHQIQSLLPPDLQDRLAFLGPLVNVDQTIHEYQLIVASGRSAIESILSGKSVFALGEYSCSGLVTLNNLHENLATNFGDIGPDSKVMDFDSTVIEKSFLQLEKILQKTTSDDAKKDLEKLRLEVVQIFNLQAIHKNIERIYQGALFDCQTPPIPILMYHKIPQENLNSRHRTFVTVSQFAKHLDFFHRQGFTTLHFQDLKLFLTGKKSYQDFPKKPLILTFDDGYKDNLEQAAPLLKQYQMKACIFLLANNNIKSNVWDISENSEEPVCDLMSSADRQKWIQYGFEVGSHGFLHQKITDLDLEQGWKEISDSKHQLEKELSTSICVYAYTYGIFHSQAQQWAKEAGYTYAVNTDQGGLRIEENPYGIFRTSIFPEESKWSLWKKTRPWYRKYYFYKRKQ